MAARLGEALSVNNTLRFLDIRGVFFISKISKIQFIFVENTIGEIGVVELLPALRANSTLENFDARGLTFLKILSIFLVF